MRYVIFTLALAALNSLAQEAPGDCREESDRFVRKAGGCLDLDTGLVWGMSTKGVMNYAKAADYCSKLEQGGKKGWRLPTKRALIQLSKDRGSSTLAFSVRNFFWAQDDGNSPDGWVVNLESNESTYESKETFSTNVLCVRREFGCAKESDRFKTADSGCWDTRTGLVWSAVAQSLMNWDDAYRYCDLLLQGKKLGWDLPIREEITTVAGPTEAILYFPEAPGSVWVRPPDYKDYMPVASLIHSTQKEPPNIRSAQKAVICASAKK